MKKMIVSLLLMIASLVTFTLPAFAEDGESSEKIEVVRTLSETTIEKDFEYLKDVEGNTFDEANYPAIPFADPQLLTVVEDCKLTQEKPEYTLYFYIYNPGLDEINFKKAPNVQLSFDGQSYFKFSGMRFGDANTGPYFVKSDDGRFLKFKVCPDKAYWENLDKNKRDLYFSGFEISIKRQTIFKTMEFCAGTYFGDGVGRSDTGVKFTFEGNNPSRMTKAIGIDALTLDLNLTYYRSTNANSGQGELNQLMTAYFMIPKTYFNEYGTISNIHYSYDKNTDVPFFVYNFDIFEKDYPVVYFDGTVDSSLEIFWMIGSKLSVAVNREYDPVKLKTYLQQGFDFFDFYTGSILPENEENYFEIYAGSEEHSASHLKSNSLKLSAQQFHDYFYYNSDKLSDSIHVEKNVSSTDPDDILSSDSYVSSTTILERFFELGFSGLKVDDDSFEVDPIVIFDELDCYVAHLSDAEFSQKYRIELDEVANVRKAANRARIRDCHLVLLRYDISQCSSQEMTYYATNKDGEDWNVYNMKTDKRMLYTENTVYQNFDIIDITFQNDQSQYIIPVVANPVEYYSPPTITPEDVYDKLGISKNDVNYTALIILAISVVVIISVTPKISAFLGRVFGGPVDKALRRNRNRRR